MFETTVDAEEGVKDAEQRIAEIEEAEEELEEFAEGEYAHEALRPDKVRRQFQEWEAEKNDLRGRMDVLEEVVDEWGGSEFEIRMLNGNEMVEVQNTQQETQKGVVAMLERAVESAPSAAPTGENGDPDPGSYPWPVMMWLSEKANSLNSAGDPDFMDGAPA